MAEHGGMGSGLVMVHWVANPFRGDKFEALWAPVAERVLDYGANGYAFFRQREDQAKFTQLAFFDDKVEWERYWLSEEVSDARVQAQGLFHVPVLPEWHAIVGYASRAASAVGEGAAAGWDS
jgi:hypothetical protein